MTNHLNQSGRNMSASDQGNRASTTHEGWLKQWADRQLETITALKKSNDPTLYEMTGEPEQSYRRIHEWAHKPEHQRADVWRLKMSDEDDDRFLFTFPVYAIAFPGSDKPFFYRNGKDTSSDEIIVPLFTDADSVEIFLDSQHDIGRCDILTIRLPKDLAGYLRMARKEHGSKFQRVIMDPKATALNVAILQEVDALIQLFDDA